MKGYHTWKPMHAYVGTWTEPGTSKSYMTNVHDVQCTECHRIVTLPVILMPDELEGCLGTAARPVKKREEDPVGFDKDADYGKGARKVQHLRV